jgi:hypothetical protein
VAASEVALSGSARAPAGAWLIARRWWPLALIVAIGSYLRLADLGALGFRWDEDLSGLAVRAILEQGVPELPSGMVYLRGGLFSYLMAASAWLYGFSEFALRLPAALFGVALIVAGYAFAAGLFGRAAGLATAGLIAISFSDIEFSRYARFYSAFSVLYVVTLCAVWKFRVQAPSAAGGVLCVVLAILTLSVHDLGYSLALAFFYPLVLRGRSAWRTPREWTWPVTASAVLGVFYVGWREFQLTARTLPAFAQSDGLGAVASPEVGDFQRSFITLPDMPLLTGMLEHIPWLFLLLVVAAVAVALLTTVKLRSPLRDRVLIAVIATCAAVQLFNFALLGAFVLAFSKRTGVAALRSAEVLLAGALIAAIFAVWLVAVLVTGVELGAFETLTLRTAVRELLDYPHFYAFWGFPNEWPLAAAVASIGALVAFDRAAGRGDVASGFALLALAVPIVSNALFASPFELFRYNAAFSTMFFVFVALAFLHWRELISAWRPVRPRAFPRRSSAVLGTTMLVMLALAYDLNPLRGWLAVEREYSNDGPLYRAFGLPGYDDFKTTAAYVARHASPEDLIITPDSREYYNYLGRVDLWLRTDRYDDQSYIDEGGRRRDLYVGTPLVMTFAEFEIALATPNRTKWVLASSTTLADPQAPVAPAIRGFLRDAEHLVVYVGKDGNRKVYRFE